MVESLVPLEGAEEASEIIPEEKAVIETDSGVYIVEVWEGDTEQVFAYLQQVNDEWIEAQKPEVFTTLVEQRTFIFFSKELIEVETEIQELFGHLETISTKEQSVTTPKAVETQKQSVETQSSAPRKPAFDIRSQRPVAFDRHQVPSLPRESGGLPSSVFSLAAKMHSAELKKTHEAKPEKQEKAAFSPVDTKPTEEIKSLGLKRGREGGHQGKNQDRQEDNREKKEQQNKWKVEAAKTDGKKVGDGSIPFINDRELQGMENIYVRFMALMARILGQAEAEAHDLYNKIKARTDRVDLLTKLVQKINSSTGGIDWEQDQEMRKMVDQARACGVDIPEGKYSWGEDEKILFKENVQMRKDGMEKITQLERTDMQRYLQEASQCHQARSNILKLLKEVLDTIIYNLRS